MAVRNFSKSQKMLYYLLKALFFPQKKTATKWNVWPFKIFVSARNLEIFQSPRKCYTTGQGIVFHKRPPQNVWPSEISPSPRKRYTQWSRYYFPLKRPPQNVWPSKKFLSPRNLYKCVFVSFATWRVTTVWLLLFFFFSVGYTTRRQIWNFETEDNSQRTCVTQVIDTLIFLMKLIKTLKRM